MVYLVSTATEIFSSATERAASGNFIADQKTATVNSLAVKRLSFIVTLSGTFWLACLSADKKYALRSVYADKQP